MKLKITKEERKGLKQEARKKYVEELKKAG
jgi:hypothetical protein